MKNISQIPHQSIGSAEIKILLKRNKTLQTKLKYKEKLRRLIFSLVHCKIYVYIRDVMQKIYKKKGGFRDTVSFIRRPWCASESLNGM